MTVGVVSPGAMGSALAHVLRESGVRVVATAAGRSPRTVAFAQGCGLELLESLEAVVAAADTVLSVVPPGKAQEVAAELAGACRRTGVRPLVAELNAVSPDTAERIASRLATAGVDVVDGAISGPPPRPERPGGTRIYLSGPRAEEVAGFRHPSLQLRVLGDRIGTASGLKMCTASIYKGIAALATHALLTAREHAVVDHVLDDVRQQYPELASGLPSTVALAATKAGRYVDEMREIAATQAAAGLTPALFEGIARVFAAVATSALAAEPPEQVDVDRQLEDILSSLVCRAAAPGV